MTENAENQEDSPAKKNTEDKIKLAKLIVAGLLVISAIPLVGVAFLSFLNWQMSTQIQELDSLNRMMAAELYLRETKNYRGVLHTYEKIAETYKNPYVYSRLGGLYARLGEPYKALQVLEQAKALEGDIWPVYRSLASINLRVGDYHAAKEYGGRAIELNPYDSESFNNLAWIHAMSEEGSQPSKQSIEYAENAVKFSSRSSWEYFDTLAQSFASSGDVKRAREAITTASEIFHSDQLYIKCRTDAIGDDSGEDQTDSGIDKNDNTPEDDAEEHLTTESVVRAIHNGESEEQSEVSDPSSEDAGQDIGNLDAFLEC